tara:strand:+ start:130 stop:573 length:444 start_codon:yes stop_codon:yes gene_type:complete
MVFIKNAFTQEVTKDRVGSKDEYNYFRVGGGPDVDRLNPEKRFYANKTEFYLHKFFNRWPGNIEGYESAIRSNIETVESLMTKLDKLSDKQAYDALIGAISNEPIVSFGVIPDYDVLDSKTPREDDWIFPKKVYRIPKMREVTTEIE